MIAAKKTNKLFPSTLISDSFEAVTNGMSNPEALEQLEFCRNDLKLSQWYFIIKAIQAFYSQNFSKMESLLQNLNNKSSVGSLKKVLLYMAGSMSNSIKLSKNETQLVKKVTENKIFLRSALIELNESLNYGDNVFIETVLLMIKEIKSESTEAAERLALWALRLCLKKNFSQDVLAENILVLFGKAEGLRLLGLHQIENNPVSALVCFLRSLIKRLSNKIIDKNEVIAYIEIIEALSTNCSKKDPSFIKISELINILGAELDHLFVIEKNTENCKKKIEYLKNYFKPTENKKKNLEINSFYPPPKKIVQLELF